MHRRRSVGLDRLNDEPSNKKLLKSPARWSLLGCCPRPERGLPMLGRKGLSEIGPTRYFHNRTGDPTMTAPTMTAVTFSEGDTVLFTQCSNVRTGFVASIPTPQDDSKSVAIKTPVGDFTVPARDCRAW